MKQELLASRYARAVLQIISAKDFNNLRNDIRNLKIAISDSKVDVKLLDSLLLKKQDKLKITSALSAKLDFSEMWDNFLKLLIDKHRMEILPNILNRLDTEILNRQNKVKVRLTVAHKLTEDTKKNIINLLEKILKKQIEEEIIFDPSLIGGFKAETQSRLIDGSIQHNLVKLKSIKDKIRG